MHLNIKKFAWSAAATMGLVYLVCAVFVSLWPGFSSQLMSWLTHIVDLDDRTVTWGGFLGGLIQVIAYTYIISLLFAWLHNRSVKLD